MEKSDFLFLSNQQKNLQQNNPDGVRNWTGTLMLMRPKPFGCQSVAQVRAYNHEAFKVSDKDSSKRRHRGGRKRSTVAKSKSTAAIISERADNEPVQQDAETKQGEANTLKRNQVPVPVPFSPMQDYRDAMDREMAAHSEFLEHPFMDPQRKMEPAYSIQGRWPEPVNEQEDIPEFVVERGPHGTWMRRRVGFLEVHEAAKRLGVAAPAFTMRERLPSEFDRRGPTGDTLGTGHTDWKAKGGFSFGVRHRHLDPNDFEGPGPTEYDATAAFNKLKNPGANESYKQVSLGQKLVDIVNKDLLSFPGPCSYNLPPAINSDINNKFNRTPGGYFSPKLVDLVNKDLMSFPSPGQYSLEAADLRYTNPPEYSFFGGYSKSFNTKKPNQGRKPTDPDEILRSIQKAVNNSS